MAKKNINRALWASYAFMMKPINDECMCTDPPGEDHEDKSRRDYSEPSCHGQYCPIYLYAYAVAISKGKPTPP